MSKAWTRCPAPSAPDASCGFGDGAVCGCYVGGKDTYEIAASMDTILYMLDRLGLSLVFSVMGSLLFDMLEKREKRE